MKTVVCPTEEDEPSGRDEPLHVMRHHQIEKVTVIKIPISVWKRLD